MAVYAISTNYQHQVLRHEENVLVILIERTPSERMHARQAGTLGCMVPTFLHMNSNQGKGLWVDLLSFIFELLHDLFLRFPKLAFFVWLFDRFINNIAENSPNDADQ